MTSIIAALSAILLLCLTGVHSLKCRLNLTTDFHLLNPPMIVSPTEPPTYVYPTPDNSSEIIVNKGKTLTIACPKMTNRASSKSTADGILQWNSVDLTPERGDEVITCSGSNFQLSGKEVKFVNVSCAKKTRMSYSPILREAEGSCLNGNRYEIGYELADGRFLRTLELCHDKEEARTLWAHDVVQPVNKKSNRYKSDSRESFKTGILYTDISMSKELPYNLDKAFNNLATILKSEEKARKYLAPNVMDRKFFAKGHLIADADKIYKSEKESTYFFANAVPMWQQINAQPGNWFFVEEYVRKLAVNRSHPLDVWVGGLGVAELEGEKIYLVNRPVAGRKRLERKIPVPKVLFKCALDKTDGEAVCFFVVNNPYVTKKEIQKPKKGYIACAKKSDMCDKLTDHFDKEELGYMYCCSLKDFIKKSKEELGLEDLQEFIDYKTMRLAPF